MTVSLALRILGILAAGYLLFVTLLAMGPIGMVVFVPLLVIGAVQVYRTRTRPENGGTDGELPDYCPNCGTAIEGGVFDATATTTDTGDGEKSDQGVERNRHADSADSDEQPWRVHYCGRCGAPLRAGGDIKCTSGCETGATGRTGSTNCPHCGSPNDSGRETCAYCEAALE
ncbi:hypothetical protein C483_04849 [Natrialba hulunbeirensis JCM 10989]|uniref:DZANK-type domain-containing protein n=1 Tax=Natrialba hulunbeirensis JCM 10989 TaxID=1227493 RepID=M0A604_9EURY|nr:hypothetical protein [Natrialba hulunbeirensis]ELY93979.1 hypothetical protein C483_04849 [Natrialba hulunbeirensis JCM 10989]